MRSLWLLVAAVALTACVEQEDDPTTLKDLRVIGMRFEPPEVLMVGCNPQLLIGAAAAAADGGTITLPPQFQQLLAMYAGRPLEFTALISDENGGGRELDYRLLACANRGDRQCKNEGDFVVLETGKTRAGELKTRVSPGIQLLDDGMATPLLLETIQQDTFRGLGGVRLPVVLDLSAPDTGERIFAQKLMVYSCQFFPTQRQNVTPVLPGIAWNGEAWPEDEVREHQGTNEVTLTPLDFSALEENYVVPSLQLTPVELVESWKITWMTTSGTMSAYNTGGTNLVGDTGRHRSRWRPDRSATSPRDVTFWFVVRDGRGGNSWTSRKVRWTP
jgi:hypothetical protein